MEYAVIMLIAGGVVLLSSQLVRARRTEVLARALEEAIRKGTPDTIDRLCQLVVADRVTIPTGPLFVALAVALVGFGLVQGDPDDMRNLGGIAIFPAIFGLVLTISGLRKKDRGT